MNLKNLLRFILLSIMWGTNFVWNRIAVTDVGPFILVFFRILFAFATILFFFIISKTKLVLTRRKLGISIILGFFNVTLPFLATSWAQQYISSGLAGIISSTYPLFSLLMTAIFLPSADQLTPFRSVGLLFGFLGAVILTSIGIADTQSINSFCGVIVMLFAPVSYAIALLIARQTIGEMDAKEQTAGQLGCALMTILLFTILFEPHLRLPAQTLTWIGFFWLGALCTGGGTLLYFSLVHSIGAIKTSLIAYVSPIIAVFLGIVVLSEKFSWQFIIGSVLVIIGLLWINYSRYHRISILRD